MTGSGATRLSTISAPVSHRITYSSIIRSSVRTSAYHIKSNYCCNGISFVKTYCFIIDIWANKRASLIEALLFVVIMRFQVLRFYSISRISSNGVVMGAML